MKFINIVENTRHSVHTYNLQSSTIAGRILIPRMKISTSTLITIIIIKIHPCPNPSHIHNRYGYGRIFDFVHLSFSWYICISSNQKL